MEPLLYSQTLTHAGMWSGVIGRGRTLRLTDLEGGASDIDAESGAQGDGHVRAGAGADLGES